MEYKVLYRKYRPTDFNNIVDQDYTIEILKNAIRRNKISHAYIFSGPRGTGKTTTAKVFAKSINCENYTEEGLCGKCYNCENFNNNPDIIEIDAASNNGVDEIRELINSVKLAPTNSRYKVYIIDEVHMLSQSAFNALLLTLEEPPKHVVFILATTNIESVPVTILSRCQRFDFKKISDEEIIKRMKYICDTESIHIAEDALTEIAYLSDGGMRDALSILDQLSSIGDHITLEKVVSHFGSVSIKKIQEILNAIEEANNLKLINIIEEFRASAVDYKHVIKKLLDVLYKKAIDAKESDNYNGLDYKIIKSITFDLVDCMNKVNVMVDPYMLIEITLLNYINLEKVPRMVGENEQEKIVIEQPKELKINVIEEKAADLSKTNIKEVRVNNCFVNAKKEFLETVKSNWAKFIDNLKDNRRLISLVIDAMPVAASDKYVILITNLSDTAELINVNLNDLEESYRNIFNIEYKFIALSENEWIDEKKIYIENIKKKYVYELKEEIVIEDVTNESNQLESLATDIFDKAKIEIN